MVNLIVGLALMLFCLVLLVMRKTYYALPEGELKWRASSGDAVARRLYRAAAYGGSLKLMLWLLVGVTAACGVVLFSRSTSVGAGFVVMFFFLWLAWGLIPETKLSSFEVRLTLWLTPAAVWLLNYLHRPLGKTMALGRAKIPVAKHTGLYRRDDLVGLLDQQQFQSDSRIAEEELQLAKNALSFGDHTVGSVLVPRKQVMKVKADDTVGPILLDELHKSGLTSFPVLDGKQIVGILHLKDVGLKSTGKVKSYMDAQVFYVHEQDSLAEVLHIFYQTKSPMFAVVNSFAEYVGVLPIEAILQVLLGQPDIEELSERTNPKIVAARYEKPRPKAKKPIKDKEVKEAKESTEKLTEVVE